MKHILIMALLFIFKIFVAAQHTYIPYVAPHKYWFYDVYDGSDIPKQISAYSIWFGEDTLVNGTKYLKVFSSNLKGSHPCQFPPCFSPNIPYEFEGKQLLGFIKEDTLMKKVLYLPNTQPNESCISTVYELYNFGLNIGDTNSICHRNQMGKNWSGSQNYGIVDNYEQSLLYNKERNVLTFTAPLTNIGMPSLGSIHLIEGVGMDYYDPFSYNPNTVFSSFCEGTFEECNIKTSIADIKQYDFDIVPNPTSDKLKINGNKLIHKIELIDLNGRLIIVNFENEEVDVSKISQGVYFIVISSTNNMKYTKKIVKI